VAVKKRAAGLT